MNYSPRPKKSFYAALFVTLVFSVKLQAQTVVSNLDAAELAAAIQAGGTVTFATNGTIYIGSELFPPVQRTITLINDVILDASGHSITIAEAPPSPIQGSTPCEFFHVPSGINFTLRNLTIANGAVESIEPAMGGAIYSDGNLNIDNCIFTGNTAFTTETQFQGGFPAFGGAIYSSGILTVGNSTFIGNGATGSEATVSRTPPPSGNGSGGAIFNDGGEVVLNNVIFLNNGATGGAAFNFIGDPGVGGVGSGGAIYNFGGVLNATNCVFSNNVAGGGVPNGALGGAASGGAIFNSGNASLFDCTFVGNEANGGGATGGGSGSIGQGGAIYNTGLVQIGNSDVNSNSAVGGLGTPAGDGEGGAIYNTGNAVVSTSTLSENISQGSQWWSSGVAGSNFANGWGGAIVSSGLIQVDSTTLINNSARGATNFGEVIYNTGAFLTDSNAVVVPNSAGTPPLSYDWQLDGTNIAGATSSTFNLTNVRFTEAGTYALLISNSAGFATNFDEIFNEPATNVPSFVLQPIGVTNNLGATTEFEAAAIGVPAPVYQWLFDGTNIAGATNSILVLTNVLAIQSGSYTVIATNYLGSATSQPAVLTVQDGVLLTAVSLGVNGFSLTGEGMTGQIIIIEASTNLMDWVPIQTNASPLTFIDTNALGSRARFYRVVVAP